HHLSAYPALLPDPSNPDPYFRRNQFGVYTGGPVQRDRSFFFVSFERNDQDGVVSVQPTTPEFASLGGVFPNPYRGNLFSGRYDLALTPNERLFVRTTYDGNRTFTPNNMTTALPSAWTDRRIQADQTVAGLTSILSPQVVNDFRVSHLYLHTLNG